MLGITELYRQPVFAFATDDGTQTGTLNAVGDYSVTPVTFYAQPPAGEVWLIQRAAVWIQDAGSFDPEGYASGTALTNGILPNIRTGTTTKIDLSIFNVKTNFGWNAISTRYTEAGSGQVSSLSVINFANVIRLVGDLNENYAFTLNDDFTGLTTHQFLLGGVQEDIYQ